ncbi:methyltransferase family protein [Ramlibacter albus]|uniref:Isoprenylcysteine carboxylmethyltransferase family protein n=1 Tax=Ramlibacter albus TaxID=2079448 RepID=A0A923MDL9_9BURK|nr:isoprenylcysteine carboxylmethyltransferase family protein [Ramlibacter albus]MBC5768085.1 isoprenylcysteine carboxylmethyltransferase family protein [Ramlibacter albus]
MPASDAVMILCGLFVLSWVVAAAWAGQTVGSMAPGPLRPLYGAGAAAGLALVLAGWAWPWTHERLWAEMPVIDWLLVAVCAAAFAFCWWARIHLGALWSAGVARKEGHRVVDTGPYAIVRHPIYTGSILAGFAWAAVRARPLAIALAVLYAVFMSIKARHEERFLREELGPDYDEYSKRVPRLVPFIH